MANSLKYKGLTDAQVVESRRLNGANTITPAAKQSLWRQFLEKFREPLIIILLIAGLMSIGISCYEYFGQGQPATAFFEPAGIFIAIFLATGLSFFFETKANREFSLLNQVNDDEPVEVIRNGGVTQVPKRDIVVGDIVILNPGQEIPADGRLLEATQMSVDESTLTGEPIARKTTVEADFDPEATYSSDAVLRGTKVMEGHGVAEINAVGDHTENGKVFEATQLVNDVVTPLDEQLGRLGKLITIVSYTIAALVVVIRMVVYFVQMPFEWGTFITHFLQSLMIAIALIVVSVPEGLPMAVTLTLAYSMRRMLKTNNLVRRMHVCETMGATTVICTDKTGTLTQNRMQVADVHFYCDAPDRDEVIADSIALNSTAQLDLADPNNPKPIGNPTEGALLLWINGRGIDYTAVRASAKTLGEIPFSTERKYMATAAQLPSGEAMLFVKGAPEIVYGMCRNIPKDADKETIDRLLSGYQRQAMRTIGLAYAKLTDMDVKRLTAGDDKALEAILPDIDLTFLGVVAIADPVREDVPAAVEEVTNAGIKVKIVTGDTPGTAREIGRRIGLWNDATDGDANITTGAEIAAMTDDELRQRAQKLKIIARARPMDKKRLVEALQSKGEIVAVTGDGTNDAPALKTAHVGLSMGDGTSVAKEASDITIIDNSFASIGRAVLWGRSLYLNLRRFILFQMTVNVAACLTVMIGSLIGLQSPLTVTQMLWVNLIMDTFAAMALSALPPTPEVMHDKPRNRKDFIISGAMWRNIFGVGTAFFLLLFGILWIFEHYDVNSMLDLIKFAPEKAEPYLSEYELSMFFSIFVFLQFWNMFNVRAFASRHSALDLHNCGEFKFIMLIIFLGQILIVSVGGEFFNVTALRLVDWVIIICGTSIVMWLGELSRLVTRHRVKGISAAIALMAVAFPAGAVTPEENEQNLILAETARCEYRIDDANKHIADYRAYLKRNSRKRLADNSEEVEARIRRTANLLDRVEKIVVIDSLTVDKNDFFRAYRLSPESGLLSSPRVLPKGFPHAEQTVVYTTEDRREMLWTTRDADSLLTLVCTDYLSDGTWEEPRPVGDNLGQGGNANYPFLMPDGITLYFASDNEQSIGGYDIFISRNNGEEFLQPQNIGMPFNSPYDDYMLAIDELTGIGWWATDRNRLDDKLTIYVYIPSEMRTNVDVDAPDLADRALIRSYRDTWDGNDYTDALNRVKAILPAVAKSGETFEFALPDGRVITAAEQLRSRQAKDALGRWISIRKAIGLVEDELAGLRSRYAAGDRSVSARILQLEDNLVNVRSDLQRTANDVIRAELK